MFYADLHFHSRFSRACSQQLTIPNIARWAKAKGVQLLGTTDFTHPIWLDQLKENLEEDGTGLLKLRNRALAKIAEDIRFIFSTELSCIYSKGDKTHKIHLVVLAPSFEVVEEINKGLDKWGKLESDGRPIFGGRSAEEVTMLILKICPECIIFPAHVWTPWFSLYGSRSGFDSIEECFGDVTENIPAVETGLSSDPAMNWLIKENDNRSIVSFSDAHSPHKIAREATVFDCELSYEGVISAISAKGGSASGGRQVDKNDKILGTIEFYPHEGKYHYTGHRSCGVTQSPEETAKKGEICPICGRPLTVGVMHRVNKLASRKMKDLEIEKKEGWVTSKKFKRPGYRMLIQLMEIIAEAMGVKGIDTKSVREEYKSLIKTFDNELKILIDVPISELRGAVHPRIAEAIEKVRKGDIVIKPGFDGVYGQIQIWDESQERKAELWKREEKPRGQISLLG